MKGGSMRDKKFAIAIGIIVVLVLALFYIVLVGPKVQGYFVKKQIEGYNLAVGQIVQQINSQGYVVLPSGNSFVALRRDLTLEQQIQQQVSGQQEQPQESEQPQEIVE